MFDFTRNHRRSLIDITSRCREDYKSASMVNCSPVAETLKIEDMKMQDVQRGPNKSHTVRDRPQAKLHGGLCRLKPWLHTK